MTRTTLMGKVELHRGQSYKSALLDNPGPYLLGLGTIARNGGFSGGSLRTYGGDSPDRILVRPGDLYLSLKDVTHRAELLGAVARVPETIPLGRLTQDTVRLQIMSHEVNGDYLYWLLRSPHYRSYCRLHGTGTTNLDLSRADFLAYEFRLPSLPEQQAIAEVLGALDDKIAANTALADSSWALAEAEFTSIQRQRAADRVSLGDIASFEYGKSLPATAREAGDVLVVGSGGVGGTHNRALVGQSGVVVGRKGSAGSVRWVSGPHFPIDTTFFVRGAQPAYSQPYLYFLLRTLRLGEMNNDSAVPGLNRAEALAIRVAVPSDESISKFTVTADALITLVDALNNENRTLAATRDALLPQLMSGKLRVRDAERIAEVAGA